MLCKYSGLLAFAISIEVVIFPVAVHIDTSSIAH